MCDESGSKTFASGLNMQEIPYTSVCGIFSSGANLCLLYIIASYLSTVDSYFSLPCSMDSMHFHAWHFLSWFGMADDILFYRKFNFVKMHKMRRDIFSVCFSCCVDFLRQQLYN